VIEKPESKLPKTTKYLRQHFTEEDFDFRLSQIRRGLCKGRDEMIKITTRYLLKAPLIYLLLMYQEHGASFLRANLSILHENPLSEYVDADVLIPDAESQSWGRHVYANAADQPDEDTKWYNILYNHADNVVHFWRQFGLNCECVKTNLQGLSREVSPLESDEVYLLHLKKTYPVLFEGLESVFGMMMSNSRLCEQIHGMMRFGLSSTIGMDQSDAIQTYATGLDYDMKRERQETAKSALQQPSKKKYRQVKHNHSKVLQRQLGTQLVEQSKKFGISAKSFLAQPGHGILTATDISITGRRVQDSANLKAHVDAEKKMAAKLT